MSTLRRASFCPNCTMPTRSYHSWDGRGHAWYYCSTPWCGKRTLGPSPLARLKPDAVARAHRRLARAVRAMAGAGHAGTPRDLEPTQDPTKLVGYLRAKISAMPTTGGLITHAEIRRETSGKIRTTKALAPVLELLVAEGFIQPTEGPRRRGRPSQFYRVRGR